MSIECLSNSEVFFEESAWEMDEPAFCDKDHKNLRVAFQCLDHRIKALFYTFLSCANYFIDFENYQYYKAWATYHTHLQKNILSIYRLYGDQLVDFSNNFPQRVEIAASSALRALQAIYGEKKIAAWSQKTGVHPTYLHQLPRVEPEGVCFGLSSVFLLVYLRSLHSGKSPLEAVKIAAIYLSQGPTDEAELTQIFYGATQRKLLTESIVQRLTTEEIAELLYSDDDFLKDRALSLLKNKFSKPELEQLLHAECKKRAEVTALLGINLSAEAHTHSVTDKKSFRAWFDALPLGAYITTTRSRNGAHATVVIKTETQGFFYDPNGGTVATPLDEIADDLWNLGSTYSRIYEVEMFPVALSSSY